MEEFVGVVALKDKQRWQLKQFEQWAERKDWRCFATSHYDWWAFPVTRASNAFGQGYAVPLDTVEQLKGDREFILCLRRCAILVCQSWDWDLETGSGDGERWTGYGVRLGKMANSLKLFGQNDLWQNLRTVIDRPNVKRGLEPWVLQSLDLQ